MLDTHLTFGGHFTVAQALAGLGTMDTFATQVRSSTS